jgi:ABC-type multidrug transport system fused ATPase/permease subunit
MGAGADWKRVRRLGRYLARDRRRLFVTLALLVPVALAGSIQPLLVGQAISVLRREPSLPWLSGLSVPQAIQTIVGLLLISVLLRLALTGDSVVQHSGRWPTAYGSNSRRSFPPRPFAVPSFPRQHAGGEVAHQVDQRC